MKETDGKQDETLPWTKRQKTKRQKQKTQKDKNRLARHGYNERSGWKTGWSITTGEMSQSITPFNTSFVKR